MSDDRNAASRPAPLVLVIDDVQEQRSALAEFLGMNGFRVATAANGFEGLTRAAESRPDIILMDLAMPGMDGLETAKLLKRERVTSGIPIVALTGQTIISDERFRAKGFAELVSKPCDPLQLAATLRRTLGL